MAGTIRLATAADAQEIAAIYSPFVLETPVSFEQEPPDAKEMASRIDVVLANHPWLVCEADGIVAGYAYASQHRIRYHYQWAADVTVYVHERFRKKGIGTALYTALLSVVPLQGYVSAYAGITLPNSGSVRLHESMGFTPVGVYKGVGHKLGRWHDVGWWQRKLQDLPDEPSQPISLKEAMELSQWHEGV